MRWSIYSTWRQHFKRLQEAGLKLKESKCDFFRAQIHFLGHMLSAELIQPIPKKLDSITNMPVPENQTKVKQFLGLVGYYRKFVPHFSDISRPLSKLMRKDTPFTWMKQCHLREASTCSKTNSVKPLYFATQTAANPTCCSPMLANTVGLVSSHKSLKLK